MANFVCILGCKCEITETREGEIVGRILNPDCQIHHGNRFSRVDTTRSVYGPTTRTRDDGPYDPRPFPMRTNYMDLQ